MIWMQQSDLHMMQCVEIIDHMKMEAKSGTMHHKLKSGNFCSKLN